MVYSVYCIAGVAKLWSKCGPFKIMALFKSKRASFGTPHAYLNTRRPRETHFVSGAPLFCYCA